MIKRVSQVGEVPDDLPHSPVLFTCDDIQETYRELTERSVGHPVRAQATGVKGAR